MICLECKKEVKSIGYKHLKSCSGISTEEYRKRYPGAQFMDNDIKLKCIHEGENNYSYKPEKHNQTSWTRLCECGVSVIHKSYQSYIRAVSERWKCKNCVEYLHWKNKKHTDETKNKISNSNKGKDYNKSRLGIKESDETKKKKSDKLKGRVGVFLNKKHTQETKLKMRLKRIDDLNKKFPNGWTAPNYNKSACKLFETINNEMGWNGQHAERRCEYIVLGYFLDYYEPTLNIVIEYDEKTHEKPKQKLRDIEKQELVTKYLNCKFIRIKQGEEQNWRNIIFSNLLQ